MYATRTLGALFLLLLTVQSGCLAGPNPKLDLTAEQQTQLTALHEKGAEASLLIYPVVMMDKTWKDPADVVGLMLEKEGLAGVHTTAEEFTAEPAASLSERCAAFGKFVGERGIEQGYALYAEFLGSPQSGVSEVRAVLVDQAGEIVWLDSQVAGDPDFDRIKPRNPMTCCQLVAARVKPHFKLADAKPIEHGRMARLWEQKSNAPPKEEQKAIQQRLETMKKQRQPAVLVYDAHVNRGVKEGSAAALAKLLNDAGLMAASPAEVSPHFKIAPNTNEQRRLWDRARAFREHVRKHPPEAAYVLLTEFTIKGGNEEGEVWTVHTVVCDQAGEWVLVDFQNNHHRDFTRINPRSVEDATRLVVKRVQHWLK
jgi:hypothetical protein